MSMIHVAMHSEAVETSLDCADGTYVSSGWFIMESNDLWKTLDGSERIFAFWK